MLIWNKNFYFKNKIYNQFLSDDTNEDFNLEIISKIISKSDKETITKIVENDDEIFLKTAFPSRKYAKRYDLRRK